jgi:protein TonB
MFATLLESRRTVSWSVGNGALSLIAHSAVLALAVSVTAPRGSELAPEPADARRAEALRYVSATPPEVVGRRPAGAARTARPARLVAPPAVPASIPDPASIDVAVAALVAVELAPDGRDLDALVSRGGDFESLRSAEDLAGREVARLRPGLGRPYRAEEVELRAIPRGRMPRPHYPGALLAARVEGDVVLQFVIDSTGAADPRSVRVLRSTHELFTRAVRSVLPRMRFYPAEIAGNKVDMVVEQPFRFVVRE